MRLFRRAAEVSSRTEWRRIAARLLDLLWQIPFGVVIWYSLQYYSDLHWGWCVAAGAIGVGAVQISGETLLVWLLGTTPGKSMMRLRVHVTGRPTELLGFRHALIRALKVNAWGLGFFFPPLTVVAGAWTIRQLLRHVPLAWERSDEGNTVATHARTTGLVLSAVALSLCMPAVAGLALALFLGELGAFQPSTMLSQAVRRSISGNWLWLHPLSGKVLSLDARWRLRVEALEPGLGWYTATFALGEGTDNSVKLKVDWKRAGSTSACFNVNELLREAGFAVIYRHEDDRGESTTCAARGARVDAGGVIYGHAYDIVYRSPEVRYSVFSSYAEDSPAAREEIASFVEVLKSEFGKLDVGRAGLQQYYWRNELTGLVVRVPMSWSLNQVTVSVEPVVSYTFVRWSGKRGPSNTKDAVVLLGLPSAGYKQMEEALLKRFAAVNAKTERTVLPSGETSVDIWVPDGSSARALFMPGKRFGWTVIWANNESNKPLESSDDHELVKHIVSTLN